jgi:hypothetical protein
LERPSIETVVMSCVGVSVVIKGWGGGGMVYVDAQVGVHQDLAVEGFLAIVGGDDARGEALRV